MNQVLVVCFGAALVAAGCSPVVLEGLGGGPSQGAAAGGSGGLGGTVGSASTMTATSPRPTGDLTHNGSLVAFEISDPSITGLTGPQTQIYGGLPIGIDCSNVGNRIGSAIGCVGTFILSIPGLPSPTLPAGPATGASLLVTPCIPGKLGQDELTPVEAAIDVQSFAPVGFTTTNTITFTISQSQVPELDGTYTVSVCPIGSF